jgi:hypothetical protein
MKLNHSFIQKRITLALFFMAQVGMSSAEVIRRPEETPALTISPEYGVFEQAPTDMSPEAKPVPIDMQGFGPDPVYEDSAYDAEAQFAIYGNKRTINKVHPLVELGQPLYGEGPLNRSYDIIGSKNLVSPQFYIYGDWRTVVASNKNGNTSLAQIVTRPSFDIDLKLTGTERLHALIRPLENNGKFTRNEFGGDKAQGAQVETNLNPVTFFFEGDLGAITSGLKNDYVKWDLPFTFGLIPLVFQNGIWLDDAFLGGAFTIPSKNSKRFDISNMDVTFFAGTNQVTTAAIKTNGVLDDSAAEIFGVTTFIETQQGYIEAGYGYTKDDRPNKNFSYHNATAAFTKRYGGVLSNSMRAIVNFGQNPLNGEAKTADGFILLAENSFITSLPSTFIPYANLFYGRGHPQSLARAAAAGGILKNVGINFETDGLTGFPKLEDTGNNTYGGAVGLEYLFELNKQVVVELATVQTLGNDSNRIAKGNQYALGARYQIPLDKAWIFRADAITAELENASNIRGVRFELRRKF